MSNLFIKPQLLDAMLQVLVAAIDADTNPGYVEFYDGVQPETPGGAHTSTLLGTCTFSKPCGTVSEQALDFDTIDDDLLADADGTLTWARVYDGAGTFITDGECGLSGSGALFIFNQTAVVEGGAIRVGAGTISFGA